ncbi:sugar ABC transporter substrate-binding protein [Paenibacillus sp. 1011MAR3C5]|uniref:ABC transporter substrate-binding protein n=1 Tax=Paenibacillus sp. 1011MAR3C5 TaxID=1675787 RepID=UPI000E6B7984|nr:sugar ABC transporter substrate-binding protein [Paenibacillus sp. 1011MAR3C5]RJE91253.1 sugar ABC transporter substrate-binding protein [Paenibacillus sp. 1011MAR3C5]
MLRRWTQIVAVVLLVAMISACGAGNGGNGTSKGNGNEGSGNGGAPSGATDTLEAWGETIKSQYGGDTLNLAFASHPSTDSFQKLTSDFEKLTGIKVKWEVMEETYLKNKQLLDYTGKTGSYDVLMVDGFWMSEYGAKKVVEPLDAYLSDENKTPAWFDYEDIVPAYRNGISKYDGSVYGIPTAGETRFIAYRKDLFEKYGKQPPATMDEFLELAQFFNGKEDGLYGVSMRAQRGVHAASGLMTVMYNFGGGFLNQQSGDVTMTDPKTVEALQFYVDLLKNAPKDVVSYTHEEALSAFMTGRTAMWLDATALAKRILDPASSQVYDKVGFAPTPEGPEGKASALAGWNMSISSQSKNKDAAWAFIVYMNSKENAKAYVDGGGVPVRTSIYENEELVAADPSYPVQLAALNDANVLVEKGISWIPPHEKLGQILDRVGYYVSAAMFGELTVQDAAAKAQTELEDITQ